MLIPTAVTTQGGLRQQYVGYNTIGGSTETMAYLRVYAKKVTLASASLLTSIDAYIRTNTDDHAASLYACVFSDNAGTPDLLLAQVAPGDGGVMLYLSKASATNGTARWFSTPIGMWLSAGDYWIGVQMFQGAGNQPFTIYYDATGSDRYQTSSFNGNADWGGLFAPTTTANQYSIRGSLLS